MPQGRVKWFNDRKGFGFITQDDVKDDIFVHHTDIQDEGRRTLMEGQEVQFELVESDKGLRAVNIVKL